MARGVRLASVCVALMLALTPAAAQQQGSFGTVISPILTIDSERLFLDSDFGKRVAREIDEQGTELARENRQIEAELTAEEERLTVLRPSMEPAEFSKLANAFDTKVQSTRRAQAAKNRALSQRLDKERTVFLTAAAPVLERLMREAEAAVVLERRSVFLGANAIDITDDAIARLNASLGEGPKARP